MKTKKDDILKTLYDIENTSHSRISKEKAEVLDSYMNLHINGNNGVHLTLDFEYPMRSMPEPIPAMSIALYRFLEELPGIAGLPASKVASFGYFFTRNNDGNIWPHFHLILASVKDRNTGSTIARLSPEQKQDLSRLWVELGGRPLVGRTHTKREGIKRIYTLEGALDYWTSIANMAGIGQRWLRLPAQNLHILKRKEKLKAAA